MIQRDFVYNTLIICALLACMLTLLLYDFRGSESLIIKESLNLGHLPLFGIFSLIVLWILNGRVWPALYTRHYAISFATAFIFGIVTEYLQGLTPDRNFEVLDIARDAIGSLCFLLLAYPSPDSSRHLFRRIKILSLSVFFLAATPLYLALFEDWQINREFPIIDSFETISGTNRWETHGSSIETSGVHSTHGSRSMEVHFRPGMYPGVSLNRLHGDWSGYDMLSFDVFLDGDKPMSITVRIHDAVHNYTFEDRYNRTYKIFPGANCISIDLSEVKNAPRSRIMDMKKIANISVFSFRLSDDRTLFFDNIKLERCLDQRK